MHFICILTTRHHGDDNRVYHKEVKTLADNGYKVLFIAPKNPNRGYPNVEYMEIPFVPRKKLRPILKHVYHVISKEQPVEVLHFQDPELLPFGLKIKRKTKIKVIYDVHEDFKSEMLLKRYLSRFKKIAYSLIVPWFERRADKKMDAIVVADGFVRRFFSNKNTIILFNYPDTEKLNNTFLPNIVERSDYDIIFPGTTTPFIFQRLVDITRICRDLGRPIKCCIIADYSFAPEREANYRYLETLGGNKDDVVLLPKVPTQTVFQYLNKAKIGVAPLPDNPKYQKNIATKIFEYMYYFLPVLSSDLPPERPFIDGRGNGYLLPPDNPREFAEKVIELLDKPDLANKMGSVGHRLVQEKWNWSNEKAKLIRLYRVLLDEVDENND